MHTTNYFDTFISVAEDCPVTTAEVPPTKNPQTAAEIQYKMIKDHPYRYTSDDVIYTSNGERRGVNRKDFSQKGRPAFDHRH